jgi:hypothetical protein
MNCFIIVSVFSVILFISLHWMSEDYIKQQNNKYKRYCKLGCIFMIVQFFSLLYINEHHLKDEQDILHTNVLTSIKSVNIN